MHELSITQSVVEICEKNAGGRRVLAVTLELGELSGIVPDAVEFCFEACTKGTLLEGARLVITRVAPKGLCRDCGSEFPVSAYYDSCPNCGGYTVELMRGEEMRVKELEVE
jgi:hydrogenase nickel incorporation protein HypA/HybF